MLKRLFWLALLCTFAFLLLGLMVSGGAEKTLPRKATPAETAMIPLSSVHEYAQARGNPMRFLFMPILALLLSLSLAVILRAKPVCRVCHMKACYYAFHFSDRAG